MSTVELTRNEAEERFTVECDLCAQLSPWADQSGILARYTAAIRSSWCSVVGEDGTTLFDYCPACRRTVDSGPNP